MFKKLRQKAKLATASKSRLRYCRPRLESLESRRVLASFFVNTVSDTSGGICLANNAAGSSACSLRDAITAAQSNPGADRLEIPTGTYLLTSGSLDFSQTGDIAFVGTGADSSAVVIDGNGVRVFAFAEPDVPSEISFENLTIQNGRASDDLDGGGAINAEIVNLTLNNVIVQNNRSVSTFSPVVSLGVGGAITTNSNLTIVSSTFRNNSADDSGGAIHLVPGPNNVRLSVATTRFDSNTAGVDGGAIFVTQDTDITTGASVVLSGTVFEQNSSSDSGGAVFLVAITNVDISGMFIANSAQGANGTDGVGGGLYIRRTTDISNGSGVRISNANFSGNRALTAGAGAFIANSSSLISNSHFVDNVVFGNGTTFLTGGGGLSVQSDDLDGANFASSRTTLSAGTVRNNTAPAGGGISVVDAVLTISESEITRNRATEAASGGGGIGIVRTVVNPTPGQIDLSITSSSITANTAAGAGGGIGSLDASVAIVSSTLGSNQAAGPGGSVGILGQSFGPQLTIDRSLVHNSTTSLNGGGIGVIDAQLTVVNSTISNNTASNTGGGIAYENSNSSFSAEVTSSTIASNSAGLTGSNVAVASSVMRFLSTIISDPQGTAPAFNFVSFPGTISSQGFNLVSDNSSSFSSSTDLVNTDPIIGFLKDNGGPVFTRELLPGSPAIDAGSNAPNARDGRGFPRPVDGDENGTAISDIGAFEVQPSSSGVPVELQNDTFVLNEDSSVTALDVVANDTGSNLVITAVSTPGNGTAVINGKRIDYRPARDFFGIDTFTYTIPNALGMAETAEVRVTVLAINDPPVGVDDRISGQPGQLIQFSINDLIANDSVGAANEVTDILMVQLVDSSGASVGSSTDTEGGGTVVLIGSQLTYTPPQRFVGNDKFFYRVSDSAGASSGENNSVTFSVIDAQSLAAALLGDPRITIRNATLTGGDGGAGFFSEGVSEGLPINEGVILSTGFVGSAAGPNDLPSDDSGQLGAPGDAALTELAGGASITQTFDATILEFDIEVPFEASISFEYIFASEEYNEFAGSAFNDVFAFFLDGRNIAIVPGANVPVSVNNINNQTNSQFFIDNEVDFLQPARFLTQFDGFTQSLEANTGLLQPGITYRLRLGISDVFDDIVDSSVLLRGKSLGIGNSDLSVTSTQSLETVPTSGTITFSYVVSNTGPNVSENTTFSNSVSVGASVVSVTTSRGTASMTSSGVSVDIGNLGLGEQALIEVVVRAPSTDSLLTSQANVSASQTDPVFSNNALTRTVVVGNGPPLGSQLSGHVFCDANGNGIEDSDESVVDATVFIDLNGNRLRDSGEPSTQTNQFGDYGFTSLIPGATTVALILPDSCQGLPAHFGTVASSISIGTLPRDLEATDFDNDGDVDLLVASDLSNSLTILDNVNGELENPQTIVLESRPQAIAAMTTSSGPTVVAVAAFGSAPRSSSNSGSSSSSISSDRRAGFVYRIQGSQVEPIRMGDGPIDVAIADFNSDGLPDIVSAASRSSDFHLLLGGSTTPRRIGALDNAISVATGDFDGDGNQDVAIAGHGRLNLPSRDRLPGQIQVLLGDGQGGFTDAGVTQLFNQPVDLRAADLVSGGGDELIVLGYLGELAVFSLSSSGVVETSNVTLDRGVRKIETGDINRDGLQDVAIVNSSTESITLLRGDGLGGLIVTKELQSQSSDPDRAPSDVAFGTFRSGAAEEMVVAYAYQTDIATGSLRAQSSTTLVRLGIGQASAVVSSTSNANVDFRLTTQLDVDGNQEVTAGDALAVISELNLAGAEGEQLAMRTTTQNAADVNDDGYISAVDALMIINYLNRKDSNANGDSTQELTLLPMASSLRSLREQDYEARLLDLLIEDQLRLRATS